MPSVESFPEPEHHVWKLQRDLPEPVCTGCGRGPEETHGMWAKAEGLTAVEYVREEEGTYNPTNGHYLCDECYIVAGMPTAPGGWVAP